MTMSYCLTTMSYRHTTMITSMGYRLMTMRGWLIIRLHNLSKQKTSYEIVSPPDVYDHDVILNWTIQFDKHPNDLQVTHAFEYTVFGAELRLSTHQDTEIVVEWEAGQKRFFNPLTLGIDPSPSSTILPEHQFSLWFQQRLHGAFYAQALNVTDVRLNGVPATKTGDSGWSLALNLPKGSHHLMAQWKLSNGVKGSQMFGPYIVE